jgi:hypothetical protein
MRKEYIFGSIVMAVIMSANVVYAAPPTQEERSTMQNEKKVNYEAIKEDKKANLKEKVSMKKEDITQKQIIQICDRMDEVMERFENKKESNTQKSVERLDAIIEKMETKRMQNQQQLEKRRVNRDIQRQNFYTQFEAKAQTDEQIAAVAKFKEIVEEAVQVRRTTIDTATKEMQLANDALRVDKKAEIVKLYNTYEADRAEIMLQAKTACDESTTTDDLKIMSKDVNTKLKQLRVDFINQLQQTHQIGEESMILAKERNKAVEVAIKKFKTTVDAAREELKLAFEVESEDTQAQ